MTDAKKERLTLTVLEVKEPEKVGAKQTPKLSFKAKGPDGKELSYFILFKESLFKEVVKNSIIDVDLEISEREYEGNIYTDRKVTQVYKDGQPVAGAKASGWQPRQDSPEQRASIETQVAVKTTAELWIGGKLKDEDDLVVRMRMWCLSRLGMDKSLPKLLDNTPRQVEKAQEAAAPTTLLDKPLDIEQLKNAVSAGVLTRTALISWGLPPFSQKILVDYVDSLTSEQRFHLNCNVASAMKAKSETESLEERLS